MNRKYMRHPSEVPIEIVEDLAVDSSKKQLHDISYGGLCFDSCIRQRENQLVRIRIGIMGSPVEIEGRVIWCRRKGKHFEVGVTFTGENEANRVRMVEQVCQIETYRKRIQETEGRKISSQEAALEWIKKYAAGFPGVMRFSYPQR